MFITKGSKVRFRVFLAEDPLEFSLAGFQPKVSTKEITGEGTVVGVWSDKPPGEGGQVRFEVKQESGEIIHVMASCVYWADGYQVTF